MNEAIGNSEPTDLLLVTSFTFTAYTDKAWLPYDGPLPESAEYQAACQRYIDIFKAEEATDV